MGLSKTEPPSESPLRAPWQQVQGVTANLTFSARLHEMNTCPASISLKDSKALQCPGSQVHRSQENVSQEFPSSVPKKSQVQFPNSVPKNSQVQFPTEYSHYLFGNLISPPSSVGLAAAAAGFHLKPASVVRRATSLLVENGKGHATGFFFGGGSPVLRNTHLGNSRESPGDPLKGFLQLHDLSFGAGGLYPLIRSRLGSPG